MELHVEVDRGFGDSARQLVTACGILFDDPVYVTSTRSIQFRPDKFPIFQDVDISAFEVFRRTLIAAVLKRGISNMTRGNI